MKHWNTCTVPPLLYIHSKYTQYAHILCTYALIIIYNGLHSLRFLVHFWSTSSSWWKSFVRAPVENMDEVIYCVNGTYRLLEFLVAVCVVAYGVSETLFGEWTVMGSTIILIHSYYNVWLRAQLGWQSFLLRRDAGSQDPKHAHCLPHYNSSNIMTSALYVFR